MHKSAMHMPLSMADLLGCMLQTNEAYKGLGAGTIRFTTYTSNPSTTAGTRLASGKGFVVQMSGKPYCPTTLGMPSAVCACPTLLPGRMPGLEDLESVDEEATVYIRSAREFGSLNLLPAVLAQAYPDIEAAIQQARCDVMMPPCMRAACSCHAEHGACRACVRWHPMDYSQHLR